MSESNREVQKPQKYGISIKRITGNLGGGCTLSKEKLTEINNKIVGIIIEELRLNQSESEKLRDDFEKSDVTFVGDYYIDIAQSKLFKLTRELNKSDIVTEKSYEIYAKVKGKAYNE